jgi:hypothetical protein
MLKWRCLAAGQLRSPRYRSNPLRLFYAYVSI